MKYNDENRYTGGGVFGASSLFSVLVIVCLTVFAVISVQNALWEDKMSAHAAEITAQKYCAESDANKILAQLRNGKIPSGVNVNGNIYSYSCSVSDSLSLEVCAVINSADEYSILKWQYTSSLEWEADDGINVWDPTE